MKIEAVILDVDGVLVGSKLGINYPIPHATVIEKLKQIREKGIPVILCTGSYYFAKLPIIHAANLRNPHITDNGALIVDPLHNRVISKQSIDRNIAAQFISLCIDQNIYLEVFTDKNYYVQKSQAGELTEKRKIFMQQDPLISLDVTKLAKSTDIIRINAFTHSDQEKQQMYTILKKLHHDISITWSSNPTLLPLQVAMVTKANISKTFGAKEALKSLGLSFDHVLGVGDNMGDWQFISLCKYAAAMENATNDLKEIISSKGPGNYFFAPHVDDHGILDVFKYFSL